MDELERLFAFSVPVWEILLRGSLIYWFLFLLLRVFSRRDTGSIAMADVLLVVLIADASQNAMAGEYKSISDGCLLIVTLWGWSALLDWAGFHFPRIGRLLDPPPLKLVQNGKMLRRNMRKEWLTEDELMSQLRQHGVDDLAQVRVAYIESDGEISVMRYEDRQK